MSNDLPRHQQVLEELRPLLEPVWAGPVVLGVGGERGGRAGGWRGRDGLIGPPVGFGGRGSLILLPPSSALLPPLLLLAGRGRRGRPILNKKNHLYFFRCQLREIICGHLVVAGRACAVLFPLPLNGVLLPSSSLLLLLPASAVLFPLVAPVINYVVHL